MVTKKRTTKNKVSKKTLNIDKNVLAISFGAISILGVFLTLFGILLISPLFFGLFAIIGLILAYTTKKDISNKLNKWGFYLNISGITLFIISITLALLYMTSILQSLQ